MTNGTREVNEDFDRERERSRELHSYLWGIGLALALTFVPFALVYWNVLPETWMYIAIGALALIQMVVHFRFFLHIGLHQKREDLHLLLFTAILLFIMVAGTIWITVSLADRMFPGM